MQVSRAPAKCRRKPKTRHNKSTDFIEQRDDVHVGRKERQQRTIAVGRRCTTLGKPPTERVPVVAKPAGRLLGYINAHVLVVEGRSRIRQAVSVPSAIQHVLCANFCRRYIRLIERVDLHQRPRGGNGNLPAQKLGSEVSRIR